MDAQAAPARRAWTASELAYLIEHAGRVPAEEIGAAIGRPVEALRAVVARLRAVGYPASLDVETCPMCGARAPIRWGRAHDDGICEACHQRRLYERTRARGRSLMGRMAYADHTTYDLTEALRVARVREPRPGPPGVAAGATEAERVAAEDAHLAELAAWEARRIWREQRAAQKRNERMLAKVRAEGA